MDGWIELGGRVLLAFGWTEMKKSIHTKARQTPLCSSWEKVKPASIRQKSLGKIAILTTWIFAPRHRIKSRPNIISDFSHISRYVPSRHRHQTGCRRNFHLYSSHLTPAPLTHQSFVWMSRMALIGSGWHGFETC